MLLSITYNLMVTEKASLFIYNIFLIVSSVKFRQKKVGLAQNFDYVDSFYNTDMLPCRDYI